MEYLFLPKEIENNRNEEVRVVDGWEVGDDKHKFVVQTRIVVGGMATVKPDWVTISRTEYIEDAIAIASQLFKNQKPRNLPLDEYEFNKKLTLNNSVLNVVVPIKVFDELRHIYNDLNEIIDDKVLNQELINQGIRLESLSYKIIGCIPKEETLLIEVESDQSLD